MSAGEEKLTLYRKAKRAALEAAKEIVKGRLDFFWASAPAEITAIRWRQYTPYFNDGSPCVFGVCEPEFMFTVIPPGLEGYAEDEDEDEDGNPAAWFDSWAVSYYTKPKLEIAGPDFPDDELMLAAFGDHSLITVQRDGTVDIDEYDHD